MPRGCSGCAAFLRGQTIVCKCRSRFRQPIIIRPKLITAEVHCCGQMNCIRRFQGFVIGTQPGSLLKNLTLIR
jgi:hypothetical protein